MTEKPIRNYMQDISTNPKSSFYGLSEEEINIHIRIKRYSSFTLTDAIAPSYDLSVIPQQGFKRVYYNKEKISAPLLIISASKEILFDLFMELISLMGRKRIGVVLDTSHNSEDENHVNLVNESTDTIVLKSNLWDFEEYLLADGYLAIAVVRWDDHLELQLDPHKVLLMYNWEIIEHKLLAVLKKYNIPEIPDMKFIYEAEHIHSTSDELFERFEELKSILNIN